MVAAIACIVLGGALIASACLKLLDGPAARAALASYGVVGERPQQVTWAELIAVELALGIAVGAGIDLAALIAAAIMLVFLAAQTVALVRGGRDRPCACFGSRGRIGPASMLFTATLGAALAALPLLPERALSADEWLAIGLGVVIVLCLGLTVAVLALGREIGLLRAQVAPASALDVPHEGPEIGARSQLAHAFGTIGPEQFGLAVFTSEGCRVCRTLEPAIASLARHPLVVLREFDEVREAAAWELADAPGSPYAVALDTDGTVLAKGTFNTGAQLESVLAAAERRRRELRV